MRLRALGFSIKVRLRRELASVSVLLWLVSDVVLIGSGSVP